MSPTAARSNRSTLHHLRSSPTLIPSTTSSSYHHQQQQQILYAPVSNPMMPLQPCGSAFQPSYVYPSIQPCVSSSSTVPLQLQGKNNRWHSKNSYQQQQQLTYNPKPVMLVDQSSTSVAPIPPSTASFLVASTFTHGPLPPGEHYSNTAGMTTHLMPQPYFKPPDVQTFCLIQDRQNVQQQQQQQQQHPMQASYYNISATNTCSVQTVNANSSFPISNLGPYTSLATFANNQFPTSVQSSSLFSNPPVGLVFGPPARDKPLPLPALEFPSFKHNASKVASVCESRVVPIGRRECTTDDWPPRIETPAKSPRDSQQADTSDGKSCEPVDHESSRRIASAVARTDEEHYSDESSTSFDFTIEAEKMVSALCNTTSSNDLGKEESRLGKADVAPLFSGAGDNEPNKTAWFADFCSECENSMSIGVQTDGLCADRSQYPELIRKTAYWGCTEAEVVLGRDRSQMDIKRSWLTCLSSATRTAITKSSTCIPVYAGDRVLADDLINAHLRISNGWLSLDNYLNKQHFPNLLDRLDPEFIACFHAWEESTCELLKQVARTFRKFGENNETTDVEQRRKGICVSSSSFPGDVLHYANCDLFVPLTTSSAPRQSTAERTSPDDANLRSATSTSSLYNFQYNLGQQESASHKESKLRSKWTIIGNPSSMISTTKSVPNVSMCDVGNKIRMKDVSTSRRHNLAFQKSLNAEFCQLRSKVMEGSAQDTVRSDRKQNCTFEDKFVQENIEPVRLPGTMSDPASYRGLYAQNCTTFAFPSPGQSDHLYSASNPAILAYEGPGYLTAAPYTIVDSNCRTGKTLEQVYGAKGANATVCVGGSQADQMEFPAIPRSKMTLLSQIEPRTFDKESEEMAVNLSAWFASMRNAQLPEEARMNENPSAPRLHPPQEMPKYSTGMLKQPQINASRQFQALQNLPNIQSTPWAAGSFISSRPQQTQHAPEEYDSSEDVRVYMKPGSYNVPKKRHQRRPNRRSDISAVSRNAHMSNYHTSNTCSNKAKTILTPVNASTLSVNVSNATLIKTSFPPASQLPAPLFNLEASPRILKRTESLSQDARQDVTWKAACASAEMLLEALNVKDCTDTASKEIDRDDDMISLVDRTVENGRIEDNVEALPMTSQQSNPKSTRRDDVNCASSYEASEDENSDSTCRLSPSTSVMSVARSHENENALGIKTNVKTDSWLIRTLNNASIVSKQKRREDGDADRLSLESSNSSGITEMKDDQPVADTNEKVSATMVDSEYPAIFSRERTLDSSCSRNEISAKELEVHAGRATYSETVRRSMRSDNSSRKESYQARDLTAICGTVVPIPGRKCQRKDPEQSYQLLQHKARRSIDKRATRGADCNDLQSEEGSCLRSRSNVRSNSVTLKSSMKAHGKKKDSEHAESKCVGKSADRGWSVWYSSRRKQSLSPLAFSKLETIRRTIWQMDEAEIFKIPRDDKDTEMIEDYCKAVKSPMFIEIVDYKLKNRVYHKVEQAVKDFRRIIYNARLYHQHDDERAKKIDVLSKKLEDLLEELFGNCDFDNVAGSPREDSPVRLQSKTFGPKSIAGRCDSAKKDSSSLIIAESSLFH